MFKKYSSYLLLANMFYQYINFFSWYLGNTQIQIESAFSLGMMAFISGLAFLLFIHISYFPRELNNSPAIPTFPPLIMLLSLNLGFFIGISNLYIIQLYKLPTFFDIFRSPELGGLVIFVSFMLIFLSVGLFRQNEEDPNPTTQSNKLITGGIYKYIRNPMYLALVILQIGLGISLSFLHISLMSIFTAIALHYFIIKREETYLRNLFGVEYENYKAKSRRWI
jgi:protein-S-isoprenylcysteine O-methyltransferase Ste14|tara:strand:+ start:182 stop:850 length:669 start_codon:yes stop_codon:yes gene_type:complete